jgi:hypothetical protein
MLWRGALTCPIPAHTFLLLTRLKIGKVAVVRYRAGPAGRLVIIMGRAGDATTTGFRSQPWRTLTVFSVTGPNLLDAASSWGVPVMRLPSKLFARKPNAEPTLVVTQELDLDDAGGWVAGENHVISRRESRNGTREFTK